MGAVLTVEPLDDIGAVIEKVRLAEGDDVALVVSSNVQALQTPFNCRLLAQRCRAAHKQLSVISPDARIQELARGAGITTYASLQAFEGGRKLDTSDLPLSAPAVAVTTPVTNDEPSATPEASPQPKKTAAAVSKSIQPSMTRSRRPLYFLGAAVGLIALLLLLVVAPTAKVTLTIAATQLTAEPIVIQGSTDAASAQQSDHIQTSVIGSDASAQFTATPTGSKTVPAVAATGEIVFETDILAPGGAGVQFDIPQGMEFDTGDSTPQRFIATEAVHVVIPQPASGKMSAPSNAVAVQAATAGAKGNVTAGAIKVWPQNLCNPGQPQGVVKCVPADLIVLNIQPTAGGVDEKTLVVASDKDVASFAAQRDKLEGQLKDQITQDMTKKAQGKQFAIDPTGSGKTIDFTVTPPLPASGDTFAEAKITVAAHGKASLFNPSDIRKIVIADLQGKAPQGETLVTDKNLTISQPSVTQASDDGTVVVNVSATGYSTPEINLDSLKGLVTGKGVDDAKRVLRNRIGDRVQQVDIVQSPFPFFFLPFFASHVQVAETFVAGKSST